MNRSDKKNRYQCKYERCAYSEGSLRFFEKHQYLKQHYDKVHAEKIYSCQLCSKCFSTTTLLKSHISYCGKDFKCSCGVIYKSNEALLTHARRKNHVLNNTSRMKKSKLKSTEMSSVLVNLPKGAQLFILHPNNQMTSSENLEIMNSTNQQQSNQACSMHVMAAVALSELAASVEGSQIIEKREISTQTEINSTDVWLNLEQETERIHNSGTQTEEVDVMSNPESPSVDPGSPWLGLSAAETQTADEEIVLRPFNLCNIQTQTPWNELNDEDSTEFAHTETQTLLSSFLNIEEGLSECQVDRHANKALIKQNSEDAGTDPMEILSALNELK